MPNWEQMADMEDENNADLIAQARAWLENESEGTDAYVGALVQRLCDLGENCEQRLEKAIGRALDTTPEGRAYLARRVETECDLAEARAERDDYWQGYKDLNATLQATLCELTEARALASAALEALKAIWDKAGTTSQHPYDCLIPVHLISQADALLATDAGKAALERRAQEQAVLKAAQEWRQAAEAYDKVNHEGGDEGEANAALAAAEVALHLALAAQQEVRNE